MQQQQCYIGAYIYGPSVHNQRIKRLHYDTTHCLLNHYIDLFLYMEEEGNLDRNSIIDLFAFHYIYQPRRTINQSPQRKNSTPYQTWLMGMMDSKYESYRGVRTYLVLNGMNINEFGIDPDMTFNNSSETMKSTYQHKANLIIKLMKYWNP